MVKLVLEVHRLCYCINVMVILFKCSYDYYNTHTYYVYVYIGYIGSGDQIM